ncbi:unnamed protein product, partial [Amoebophrya sp. A25]
KNNSVVVPQEPVASSSSSSLPPFPAVKKTRKCDKCGREVQLPLEAFNLLEAFPNFSCRHFENCTCLPASDIMQPVLRLKNKITVIVEKWYHD